jgi:hypothetical protein
MKAQYFIQEKNFSEAPENGWEYIAQEIDALKKKRDDIELEIELKQKVLLALGEFKNTIGKEYYMEQILRKGTIDYSAIPEIKHIDLETYRKPSTSYWKIQKYI